MGKLLFLKNFVHSPNKIGSITPSSTKLAQRMVSYALMKESSIVVELGAGTGVITKTILESVNLDNPLIIFENDITFKSQLAVYQNCIIFEDAFLLSEQLNDYTNKVDFIFCGLPLLNFPRKQVENLLHQVYDVLKPGGKFIGFQYTPFIFPMLKNKFSNTVIEFELRNIPPAFVYISQKELT